MPLSEHALTHALERIGVQAPVRFDEITRSTQLTAVELARQGAPEWTLVGSNHQTEGRGRLGRSWVDEPDRGLIVSVVLRPQLHPEQGGLLTLLAGWAMATACRLSGTPVGCRWPNDLVTREGKVGGILAESLLEQDRFAFVVLGTGVNIGQAPYVHHAAAIEAVDPADLLEDFLRTFVRRYEPTHPAFAGAVTSSYRDVCVTLGNEVSTTTVSGARIEGRAVDVDQAGGLVVSTQAGPEVVRFGEIRHLR
ncbi:MAG TPA: biotin--[acetyl-CoA-carboxylase] ligase [Actinomycetota bacterium]|nr:biotin--[acetyl-CoA-carboxylase] ligase [Actinomycetota bacterium]